MLRSLLHPRDKNNEAGQALALFGLMVFVLLGFCAMSVDVGRYVWARTSMQAGVDAAAIAAAQDMPDWAAAQATAATYWADNSGFIQSNGTNVQFQVSQVAGNKRIRVEGDADVPTWFARFFGVNNWHVSASGDAEAQVLDIAVVLDVSGSMCYDPPGTLTTENSETYRMSPGHPAGGVPTITTAIAAGGGNSIVITLSSNAIFNSTNSGTNNTNFGYSSSNRYHQQTMGSRNGIIAIFASGGSGAYELFDITAIGPGANQLTVTRAQNDLWPSSTATSKIAHSVGAEVWANRSGCDKAARYSTPGNYGLNPFDPTIDAAQYFTTLFNPSYDKIGVARYSTNTASVTSLSSSLASVSTSIGNFAAPAGSTNIAGGISAGRQILDGSGKRANAVRVLVLLTDGIANYVCGNNTAYATSDYNALPCSSTYSTGEGATADSHAYSEAQRAVNGDIIIFVIGLGDGVHDSFLERVADGGVSGVGPCQQGNPGCRYYFAPSPAQLDDAFKAIAEQTHIALVK